MQLTIITYHYVRDLSRSRYPSIKGLDARLFREQLDFLKANYTFVRMEEVLQALDGEGELPENALHLTFDDAYIDHFITVFPLLDKMGIQGTFFPPGMILETKKLLDANKIQYVLATGDTGQIYNMLLDAIEHYRAQFDMPDTKELIAEYSAPSRFNDSRVIFIKKMLQTVLPLRVRNEITDELLQRFVGIDEEVLAGELYCSTEQLLMMKRHGMSIGLHGSIHGRLGSMKKDEYEEDIIHARDYMSGIGLVDKNAWVLSYPYGSQSDEVVEFIRSNGCVAGVTTQPRSADLQTDDRLLLPRFDTTDFPPMAGDRP